MSTFRPSQLSGTPHIMPSPTNIPWNADAMPWTITPCNGVMEFNAPQQLFDFDKKHIHNNKRKSTDIVPLPTKQFITEEKMAAHLNGLHISSDYVSHSKSESGFADVAMESDPDSEYFIPMSTRDLEEKLKKAHRITICDQIKKLDEEDTIIPKALLARVEKPCTALVLWQPPPKLTDITENVKKTNNLNPEDIEGEDRDNNNSTNLDFNYTMETDM